MQKRISGAPGQDHVRLDAKHFILEDRSSGLSDIIIRFKKKAENELIR